MTEGSQIEEYALGGPPVRVLLAEGAPGLFDVEMADGTWRRNLHAGQVRYLTDVVDWPHIGDLSAG